MDQIWYGTFPVGMEDWHVDVNGMCKVETCNSGYSYLTGTQHKNVRQEFARQENVHTGHRFSGEDSHNLHLTFCSINIKI